jgi:hypothetical protein
LAIAEEMMEQTGEWFSLVMKQPSSIDASIGTRNTEKKISRDLVD